MLLSALLAGLWSVPAAATLIYTVSGVFDGSLDGVDFSDRAITFTAKGERGPLGFRNTRQLDSFSAFDGSATYTFAAPLFGNLPNDDFQFSQIVFGNSNRSNEGYIFVSHDLYGW